MQIRAINRRQFGRTVAASGAVMAATAGMPAAKGMLRLGVMDLFESYSAPDEWIAILQRRGLSAAKCPVGTKASDDEVRAYAAAAAKADVVIAEVPAWSNPLSPDTTSRKTALDSTMQALDLADRINALCAVNLSGSRGKGNSDPLPENLTKETFDLVVESVRTIIDGVRPRRAFYVLEPMPWQFPDTADSYLGLIRAIDRTQFAAHLDIVNIINSPRAFFDHRAIIKENFDKLGSYIKTCHIKDSKLHATFTVHLEEVQVGEGGLDYGYYLTQASRLPGLPLLLEHAKSTEIYDRGVAYLRSRAAQAGVGFR